MRNIKIKKIPLDKKECTTIIDWYMFVEPSQRTSIDGRFLSKIERAIPQFSKKQYDSFYITAIEAQIIGRWHLMIPLKIRDNLDNKIYRTLERFIDKQG
jgi:hypothetical protein